MNKRGFLKIMEASIAIVIILSVLFVLYNRNQATNEVDLSESARSILGEMSKSVVLREAVITQDKETVEDFVSSKIPEGFLEHEVRICEINEVCGMSHFIEKDVYVGERVISSTLNSIESKKVRLFIWRK